MTMETPQVRRATTDDLQKLTALWQAEGLPAEELAKRFKEFQVIEGANGALLGVMGLQIAGLEGRIHSEAYARPEDADALRALFWERLQVVAQNHGLFRLWSQFSTPFWNHSGFQVASQELLGKLPAPFNVTPHPWRFLQLKDEPSNLPSLDKEFALFKEIEHERTERLLRQAKVMKLVAAVVVMAVFILVACWIVAWYRTQSRPH